MTVQVEDFRKYERNFVVKALQYLQALQRCTCRTLQGTGHSTRFWCDSLHKTATGASESWRSAEELENEWISTVYSKEDFYITGRRFQGQKKTSKNKWFCSAMKSRELWIKRKWHSVQDLCGRLTNGMKNPWNGFAPNTCLKLCKGKVMKSENQKLFWCGNRGERAECFVVHIQFFW